MVTKINLFKRTKQKETPKVFYYRRLRSSLLFAFIWFLAALTALSVIWFFEFKLKSEEGFTLLIASLLSLILAFHSLEQRGSPYVYLYNDRLKIHYSFLRDVTIFYPDLSQINVIHEELELTLNSGSYVILNLRHLSFQDQSVLLAALQNKVNKGHHLPKNEFF